MLKKVVSVLLLMLFISSVSAINIKVESSYGDFNVNNIIKVSTETAFERALKGWNGGNDEKFLRVIVSVDSTELKNDYFVLNLKVFYGDRSFSVNPVINNISENSLGKKIETEIFNNIKYEIPSLFDNDDKLKLNFLDDSIASAVLDNPSSYRIGDCLYLTDSLNNKMGLVSVNTKIEDNAIFDIYYLKDFVPNLNLVKGPSSLVGVSGGYSFSQNLIYFDLSYSLIENILPFAFQTNLELTYASTYGLSTSLLTNSALGGITFDLPLSMIFGNSSFLRNTALNAKAFIGLTFGDQNAFCSMYSIGLSQFLTSNFKIELYYKKATFNNMADYYGMGFYFLF